MSKRCFHFIVFVTFTLLFLFSLSCKQKPQDDFLDKTLEREIPKLQEFAQKDI